jgi:hypothetical protein
MNDPKHFRKQASRLLAMALTARDRGKVRDADELTDLAKEMLAVAEELQDQTTAMQPPPAIEQQHVAQQQQQPQAEPDKKKE